MEQTFFAQKFDNEFAFRKSLCLKIMNQLELQEKNYLSNVIEMFILTCHWMLPVQAMTNNSSISWEYHFHIILTWGMFCCVQNKKKSHEN